MRLLSDAISAINISRHRAGMYPQGHPAIEAALTRAFEALQRLFKGKDQITLAAAKDLLFAGETQLEKNIPAYREFALCLSARSIALVTLARGLSREELSTFQRFLAADPGDAPPDALEEKFSECGLSHISAEFIDYEAFAFAEGKITQEQIKRGLWARYVQDLLKGALRPNKYKFIRAIPPEVLSALINETDPDRLNDDACDRVMAAYLWQSLEKVSWVTDLNKLMKFINRLRPELKQQLLTSSLRVLPREMNRGEELLEDFNVDEALELLDTINENQIAIPEAIRNLIEKFSMLSTEGFEGRTSGSELIIDDIPLPYDISSMSADDDFSKFVTDAYTAELHALLAFEAGEDRDGVDRQEENEWQEEALEKGFNQILLELISFGSEDLINQQDLEYFRSLIKEQIEHFIGTGQYDQILKILSITQAGTGNGASRFTDLTVATPETAAALVDSFRIVGFRHKEDAMRLCAYFGERIVPPLIDALIEEGSRRTRKFLLDLARHMADESATEAMRRLSDTRWYVKRNLLLIISESNSGEAVSHVRPYCYHDNLKVSFYALKYMLRADERYGVEVLKHYLRSPSGDKVEMALRLASTFGITAIVPELITKLTTMDKRDADLDNKIAIVKTLGQLGDPRALGPLKAILDTRTVFFRDPLKKLKEEVAHSLKNYPPEEVRMMVGSFLEKN